MELSKLRWPSCFYLSGALGPLKDLSRTFEDLGRPIWLFGALWTFSLLYRLTSVYLSPLEGAALDDLGVKRKARFEEGQGCVVPSSDRTVWAVGRDALDPQ